MNPLRRHPSNLTTLLLLQKGYRLVRKESEEEIALLATCEMEEGASPLNNRHKTKEKEEVGSGSCSFFYPFIEKESFRFVLRRAPAQGLL